MVMQPQRGNKVTLPELHVSDSSEAILSGRKPPFRLLVRALVPEGRNLRIRHAISEVRSWVGVTAQRIRACGMHAGYWLVFEAVHERRTGSASINAE